ncbi:cupin domain-containing protein [Neptunomonas sp.]|uniref:cupin domain-containing protein n=1 Tax=Neptunomonas TaxID=75687 RepID=UPI003512C46C
MKRTQDLHLQHLNAALVGSIRIQPKNTQFKAHQHWSGEEILVIAGTFYDEHGSYPAGTWLRSPHMSQHTPFTKEDGALIYVKTGHL